MTSIDPTDPTDPKAASEDGDPVDETGAANQQESVESIQPAAPEPAAGQAPPAETAATVPESAASATVLESAGSATIPESAASPTAEQQRFDRLCQHAEASIARLAADAARVSALAGGTRFSTLQKAQYGFVTEMKSLTSKPAVEPAIRAVESIIDRAERLLASLSPPAGAEGNPASLRQALIRGMILLAPAPLHLQIEFAPDFPFADGDPIALAARSHAISRTALGSLRRIQWEAPGRASLWFGDGEQRRVAAAQFDAGGKVDLPPEFRQKQSPPGQGAGHRPAGAGQTSGHQQQPRVELMGPPSPFSRQRQGERPRSSVPQRQGLDLMGPPSPFARQRQGQRSGERPRQQRAGAPAGSQDAATQRSGSQAAAPREDGQQPRGPQPRGPQPRGQQPRGQQPRGQKSGQPGGGAGRQGQAPAARNPGPGAAGPTPPGPHPQGPRRDQPSGGVRRDRDDRRERGDRQVRQAPRAGGGFPANSMLADKLRAALAPTRAPTREAPPVAAEASPAPVGEAAPSEKE